MATIGKKKYIEIQQISVIHSVLIEELKEDAAFLETPPYMWGDEDKKLYDILILHERRLKKEIEKILERRGK